MCEKEELAEVTQLLMFVGMMLGTFIFPSLAGECTQIIILPHDLVISRYIPVSVLIYCRTNVYLPSLYSEYAVMFAQHRVPPHTHTRWPMSAQRGIRTDIFHPVSFDTPDIFPPVVYPPVCTVHVICATILNLI